MLNRESDLTNQGYYLLAQELIYQWFGSWLTPTWWSDAHINKAVVGFVAASTILEVFGNFHCIFIISVNKHYVLYCLSSIVWNVFCISF